MENEKEVEITQEELQELLRELPIILEELEKNNVIEASCRSYF